jgi:hypothetical protein
LRGSTRSAVVLSQVGETFSSYRKRFDDVDLDKDGKLSLAEVKEVSAVAELQ